MKYFVLVWAGLWRKKMRTIFTILSIVTAFLLFGVLQGVNSGFNNIVGDLNVNRLYAQNKYSLVEGMPVSHANQIATVSGVTGVSYLSYMGGYYQDKKNSIGVFAANVPTLLDLHQQSVKIPKEQVEAMRTTRAGAIVARALATKYGWKIGDTVPIGTSIWTKKDGRNDYQFQIVGIMDVQGTGAGLVGPNSFFANYDYFNEARLFGTDKVDIFVIGIVDPHRSEEISKAIDGLFANSGAEVETQSEQALMGNQLKQVADINFIVNAIVSAVLVTLLFLTANTMMQSMRERIPELAVLKTIGFSDGAVSILVLCESLLLCVLSALVGLLLARAVFAPIGKVFGNMEFSAVVIYMGVGIAVALAIISGGPPALRARYLNIVDALAGR